MTRLTDVYRSLSPDRFKPSKRNSTSIFFYIIIVKVPLFSGRPLLCMPVVCFTDDSLGADAYWSAGLHLYTPLPFRPGRGGLGDKIKTHFFLNTGNLACLDTSMRLSLLRISCCYPSIMTGFQCGC